MNISRSFLVALTLINCAAAGVVIVRAPGSPAQAMAVETAGPTIRAGRIELVDQTGQVRGQFFVEDNGEAVFRMRDENGRIRVKLGASDRGAGLVLMDDRTEPGVQIRAGVDALTRRRDTGLVLRDGESRRTLAPLD